YVQNRFRAHSVAYSLPERFDDTRKSRTGHHDQTISRAAATDLHGRNPIGQSGVACLLFGLADVRGQLVACRVFTLHDKRDNPQIPDVAYSLLDLAADVHWGCGIQELAIRGQ